MHYIVKDGIGVIQRENLCSDAKKAAEGKNYIILDSVTGAVLDNAEISKRIEKEKARGLI